MFEGIATFFKKIFKPGFASDETSKNTAKERLHLVLMQDRANVSADFLDLMKQEIIDVIKKYIVVDEKEIDVRLTNQSNDDGTTGAPALYANIPIINIKNDVKGEKMREQANNDNIDNEYKVEKEAIKVEEPAVTEEEKNEQELVKETDKDSENEEEIIDEAQETQEIQEVQEDDDGEDEVVENS